VPGTPEAPEGPPPILAAGAGVSPAVVENEAA
jgi:hypothetical protein